MCRSGEKGIWLFGFCLGDEARKHIRSDKVRNGDHTVPVQLIAAAGDKSIIRQRTGRHVDD